MTRQPNPIRVIVVDDKPLSAQGIATILGYQEGIVVVGIASNGEEAPALVRDLMPDVILMDVRMPVLDGVAAVAHIRQICPACRVLMLTTFDDQSYVVTALRAGAVGYLLKDIAAPELAQAVRAAFGGTYQLDPGVAARLLAELPTNDPASQSAGAQQTPSDHGGLTGREREILRLIAQGATNREIAAQLVVTEGTVKNHVTNILSRLGLRDRTQAALYAHEHGLL